MKCGRGVGPVELKRKEGGQGEWVGTGARIAKGTYRLLLQTPFNKLPLSECLENR